MLFNYVIVEPAMWPGRPGKIVERGQFDWPFCPPVGFKIWVRGGWHVVTTGEIDPNNQEKITTLVLYPEEKKTGV